MNPNELIDALGGTTAVARLLGIKAPSVHAWRTGGIPDDKLIRLAPVAERRSICSRRDLRPNDWMLIWPELANLTLQSKQATAHQLELNQEAT
ncbi:MAG: DNA-binding transcriptional regulator Cro [Glomeribacter sp. 1016415]|nr:DNA-binding transcriptional regulator Cro [Glomeribacter sp. 1016415]